MVASQRERVCSITWIVEVSTVRPSYVDPATLKDEPLILKRIGEGDYSVRAINRVAGRIMLKSVSGSRAVWLWTVTGPYIPSELQPSHGDADSLEDAMAAFRSKFNRWREWAETLGHDVVWNG
jgi:hypothetical protein